MRDDDLDMTRDRDPEATRLAPTSNGKTTPARASSRIGNYVLVEKVGEGGMGEVWAADQVSPIRRRVALKIVKHGMDTREFTARFASEQQALALMDHPYIAHVYDAGTTERGRPYFVMEYVEGVPILQHCDERRSSVRERVELFIRVCEGIQHAHQKAIIHRDIKPTNVLVTEQEGVAWPKIIDFGVAKALDQKLTEATMQTELGQLIGSPGYMSPEQADMTGRNIDTRTDIYLLGMLLYEMLTGVLPFDRRRWQEGGLPELLRLIREVEPPRPSARIAELDDVAEVVATDRGTTAVKLSQQLRGELDWIVMMALEKERARRYETVGALTQDLHSYLIDEPVRACPPSRTYRLKKFARRNRTGVIAASVVLGAIVLGILGTTAGMVQAKRAERIATAEARAAKEVADFMVRMFSVADPSEARGNSITAREILDRGVDSIEHGLDTQPLTRARLMNTMGRVYKELGLFGPARPLLEKSLSTLHSIPAAEPLDDALVRNDLGTLLWKTGDFGVSREHLETSLAVREKELGPDHPDVAQSLNSLGNLEWVTGNLERARALYERALTIRETSLGPNDPEVAITLNNLGGLTMNAGDHAAAKSYLERALAIRETALGADHPDVANSLASLGSLAFKVGDNAEARRRYEQALAIREKVLGASHPLVATTLKDLAGPLEELGDFVAAQAAYDRALAIQAAALGPDHPDVANTLTNYAVFLRHRGDDQQVKALFERSLAIWEQAVGKDNVMVATCQSNMAVVLMGMGDFAGAIERLDRALAIQEANYGPEHAEVAHTLKNMGDAHQNLQDYPRARSCYERSLAIMEKVYGPDNREVTESLQGLGQLLTTTGDFALARPVLERAVAVREATLGPDNVDLASSLSDLALLFYYTGDHDNARRTFQRALAIQEKQLPPDNRLRRDNCYNLACLTALAGDRAGALDYLRQAVDGGFANPVIDQDPDLASLHGDPDYEALVRRIKARAAGA